MDFWRKYKDRMMNSQQMQYYAVATTLSALSVPAGLRYINYNCLT
jgi:hypothetical protein